MVYYIIIKVYFDKAELLYKQCYEMSKIVLGEDHPDLMMSMSNLALLYTHQGLFDKAKAMYEQSVLGEDHPDTLAVFEGFTAMHEHKGNLNE